MFLRIITLISGYSYELNNNNNNNNNNIVIIKLCETPASPLPYDK